MFPIKDSSVVIEIHIKSECFLLLILLALSNQWIANAWKQDPYGLCFTAFSHAIIIK